MDKLLTQVRKARRRLLAEQFMSWLIWCAFAALAVAAIAIAVPQLVVVEGLPANWATLWLVGAAIASVIAAGVATYLNRRTALDAAIEIDRRYDLRERVASSLALAPSDLETEAGRALLSDAARRIDRIDISDKFRPHVDRRAWLPVVPAVLVAALMLLGSNREAISSPDPNTSKAITAQAKKANEDLQKKLEQMKKEAEKKDLKGAEEVFKQLEEETKELNKDGMDSRKKSSVKLNNLKKQLEERRAKVSSSEELQKQLDNMKELTKGPADKIAKAMKEGDWKKALEELKDLQDKIASDDLTEKQKQELGKQLEQMKQKLAEANQANQDAMENLKKQIDEQRKKGDLAKAGELQQKLDQMMQNQPRMDNLNKLAEKLGQCQECTKNGDKEGAAQAMSELADQMAKMQQEGQEMEMLDEALAQLEAAKDAMGQLAMEGQFGQGMGNDQFNEQPGNGMGAGRGSGPRPDEENPTQFRDSRVRQKPGAGSATFGGFVDGPNMAGETAVAEEEELSSINSEPADPLTSQKLPRGAGEHAEEYFKQLRDL